MNRVEYKTLFRDLNPEDTQAITAKLKEEKRDFLVKGTSILVAAPINEIDKLHLEISASGLARSGRRFWGIDGQNRHLDIRIFLPAGIHQQNRRGRLGRFQHLQVVFCAFRKLIGLRFVIVSIRVGREKG